MFAEREEYAPEGTREWYACQNKQAQCNYKEKVHESKK